MIYRYGRGFTDYWVCKKGARHYGLGAAGTLPFSLFDTGWDLPLPDDSVGKAEILTNIYVTCDAPRLIAYCDGDMV